MTDQVQQCPPPQSSEMRNEWKIGAGLRGRGECKLCAINHKGAIKNETELKEITINRNINNNSNNKCRKERV